jgi:hypothetical protein
LKAALGAEDAFGIREQFLGAPHHASSGLEIAIGDMKQAMPFDHEFAGMLQLLVERGNRARCFGRRHDPAPVSALVKSARGQGWLGQVVLAVTNADASGSFNGTLPIAELFHRRLIRRSTPWCAGEIPC